jgi:hypothetical protein
MVEEELPLTTPCTKFDFSKMDKDSLITFAITGMEGAAEEAQKRGLGYLLPPVAR